MKIEKLEVNDWLNVLESYQKEIMLQLINSYGEEGAVDKWLEASSTGIENMVPFGGQPNGDKSLMNNLKKEFNKFICGHPDYKNETTIFLDKVIKPSLVLPISTIISSATGIALTTVLPTVTLLLYLAGKIGIKAYCETYYN